MASYKRFEDLPIWQEDRDFSKKVFWASKEGDFSKEYLKEQNSNLQIPQNLKSLNLKF